MSAPTGCSQSRSVTARLATPAAAARATAAAAGHLVTCGPTVTLGAAAHFAGLCAAAAGDLDDAIDWLGAGRKRHVELGAAPAAIRSDLALADALGRRDASGDEARRADALRSAAERASELGPCLVVDDVRAATAGTQRPPTAPLSPREQEILRLVAEGSTNREIADEVHTSVKTVERHLGNLYTKLGVRNRAGATAWALRHELG